jgi:hypothetical protein
VEQIMQRTATIIAALLLLAGCELLQSFENPTITDTTDPWMSGDSRVLTAEIDVPSGYELVAVYARFSRHHWPGPADAHEAVATLQPGGIYRATPAQAVASLTADHLFYEWFLDYRLPDGNEIATARSGRQDFVVGCSENAINATIDTLRALTAQFATSQPHFDLVLPGYGAVPHGNTSLAGIGVTFAGAASIFTSNQVTMEAPGLLFFAPRAREAGETEAAYNAAIANPLGFAGPYRLIGGAWGKIMDDAERRPSLGCIPSSEWFLHEAGYHLQSGVMALRAPDEDVAGETVVDDLTPTPGLEAPTPNNVLMWHPRVWDLHLWLPQQAGERTALSIFAPFDVPGAGACSPMPDDPVDCSSRVFFYPETFE